MVNVRVVLVAPEHAGNVGAIARLMKNFGLSRLCLVAPQVELENDAYARAVHAGDVLAGASIVGALDEALAGVDWVIGTTAVVATKSSNLRRTAITVDELATRLQHQRGEAALLFGREGSGLSNRELDRCDVVMSIPSSPTYRALNVASAAAIIFYELWTVGVAGGGRGYGAAADASARARLLALFTALAVKEGAPPHRRRLAATAFKNVLSRAFISKREASLLIGVLRRAVEA
jgi:tRNA/rRNA methyltransferase